MLKGEQTITGLKTCEKGGYIEQTCECRNKTNKNQGLWVIASRTLEQVCVRMSSTYVRRSLLRKSN